MQEIFNFVCVYWKEILSGIVFVVGLILLIVRKRPVNDIYSWIYQWCLLAVNAAEKTGLTGPEKLDFALDFVREAFSNRYGSNAKLPCTLAYIEWQIESILTTPQKKGE